MAKQDGIIPLKGSIDKLTFVRRKSGGYGAQKKSSIDPQRIANDPAFARTRENGAEFGRAGKAGKLIRASLANILGQMADKTITGRLVKVLMRIVKSDTTSERGKRKVTDGELGFLENFEFNATAPLNNSIKVQFESTINRVTGEMKISIPGFVPARLVLKSAGATHFRLTIAALDLDFENQKFAGEIAPGDFFPLDETNTDLIEMVGNVPAASTHPLFLLLGIEFFQIVNGKPYPLTDKSSNALSIVKVSNR